MDHSLSNSYSLPPDPDSLSDVVEIMAILRGPHGCPWDREQTAESLKPYLLEEAYEVLEALDTNDAVALKEELGDLLLQILFHSRIAQEQGKFSYQEVTETLGKKLIRRHPHVFHKKDTNPATTASEVRQQWDQLKRQETQNQENSSVLDSIPKISPALQRAFQVQKRAARVGFDWKTIEPVLEKLKEELDELYAAANHMAEFPTHSKGESLNVTSSRQDIESELGDVLFSVVNISRFLNIHPEEALRKATNKFIRRFQYVESQAFREAQDLHACTSEELDQWWEQAKIQDAHQPKTDDP